MHRIRVPERTATPEELEDDRQRWIRAMEAQRPPTIAEMRKGLDITQNLPAVSMAELVEGDRS
jgi:hypothetical protein